MMTANTNHRTGPLPELDDAALRQAVKEVAREMRDELGYETAPAPRTPTVLPPARYSIDQVRARKALYAEVFPDEPGAFTISYKAFALLDPDFIRMARAFDDADADEQAAMMDRMEAYVWEVVTGWNLAEDYTRANLHRLGPALMMRIIGSLTSKAEEGEAGGSSSTAG
jgi:hypothetical protein